MLPKTLLAVALNRIYRHLVGPALGNTLYVMQMDGPSGELGDDASSVPTLNTLTSLNKEVRPFFPGDKSIWSFPSVSSLSD